jgi:hypothetical protein
METFWNSDFNPAGNRYFYTFLYNPLLEGSYLKNLVSFNNRYLFENYFSLKKAKP